MTSLHQAAAAGDLETVKKLISESKARQYITDEELEYYLNKIKEAYVILNNDIERFKNEKLK